MRRLLTIVGLFLMWIVIAYVPISYVLLPSTWKFFSTPAASSQPIHAVTTSGLHADPINIKIVATEQMLRDAFTEKEWTIADPVTIKSSILIAWHSFNGQPYPSAPVSTLLLFNKPQDLAFQLAGEHGPRTRHHVRFWRSGELENGVPVWWGAASYDQSVGLSHFTGQFTHHIAPDIDRERDNVVAILKAQPLAQVTWLSGYQPSAQGKNGGGDKYYTDQRLAVVRFLPVR